MGHTQLLAEGFGEVFELVMKTNVDAERVWRASRTRGRDLVKDCDTVEAKKRLLRAESDRWEMMEDIGKWGLDDSILFFSTNLT